MTDAPRPTARNLPLLLWMLLERKIQAFRGGEYEMWMEGYVHLNEATARAIHDRIIYLETDNHRLERERIELRAAIHAGAKAPHAQQQH